MRTTFLKTRSTCDSRRSYLGPPIYLAHLLMYPIAGAVIGWMTTGTGIGALQFSLSLVRLGRAWCARCWAGT